MAKKTKKKPATKKSAATKSPDQQLGSVSYEQLQAELSRRGKDVKRLERRREKLQQQIAEIDAELAAQGALGATGAIRKRPKNEMSLVETLQKVLNGKTMSVTDAAQAARDEGYLTTASNFRTIVNQTLIRENKKFKKVSRGMYTAR